MSEEITNIADEFPEMLRDLWRPAPAGQFLDQRYGAAFFEPCHDRALGDLLDKIDVRVTELLSDQAKENEAARKELSEQDKRLEELEAYLRNASDKIEEQVELLAQTEREKAILETRLKDALEEFEPPMPVRAGVSPPVVTVDVVDYIAAHSDVPGIEVRERNGVTPPRSGVTERVWRIADKITYAHRQEGKFPASKAEAVAVAMLEGIKDSTAGAAYSQWCKFFEINPKDTSQPYVHKEAKETVVNGPETVFVVPPPPPIVFPVCPPAPVCPPPPPA